MNSYKHQTLNQPTLSITNCQQLHTTTKYHWARQGHKSTRMNENVNGLNSNAPRTLEEIREQTRMRERTNLLKRSFDEQEQTLLNIYEVSFYVRHILFGIYRRVRVYISPITVGGLSEKVTYPFPSTIPDTFLVKVTTGPMQFSEDVFKSLDTTVPPYKRPFTVSTSLGTETRTSCFCPEVPVAPALEVVQEWASNQHTVKMQRQ
ncbi:hypothetical protein F5878DRAFT_647800, partial [Lentinula raphanica]